MSTFLNNRHYQPLFEWYSKFENCPRDQRNRKKLSKLYALFKNKPNFTMLSR